MSEAEKRSVLSLFPYFNQKHPVVFDVGSNKGDFAELFVDRVAEIHLFEPNEILLHYSMVRFCDRRNVKYYGGAICHKECQLTLSYFTNENNGLSNIFGNPRWVELPVKQKNVWGQTLDWYAPAYNVIAVDFLKIDVEGAEMLVLQGAQKLLSGKQIKFIQVEKAEHILLSGYTFDDLTNYLASFGYKPIQTEDTENVIFAMEDFTQNWNSEFIKNTEFLKGKVKFALEVGCFEGLTTNYICDFLLDKSDKNARLIAVDPLWEQYLPPDKMRGLGYNPDDPAIVASWPDFKGQFERFSRNTKGKPVELFRDVSRKVWKTDAFFHYRFDFIYIDGDHTEDEVFNDGMEAFRCCLKDGYILFDDYGWREETKRGIDRVLEKLTGLYERVPLQSDYQVMIKKLIHNFQ
jgi:FkbM family methyltransferase